jgi:hypothetical protein
MHKAATQGSAGAAPWVLFAVGWVMYRLDFKGLHFDLVVILPRRRGPRGGEAVAALLEAAGEVSPQAFLGNQRRTSRASS